MEFTVIKKMRGRRLPVEKVCVRSSGIRLPQSRLSKFGDPDKLWVFIARNEAGRLCFKIIDKPAKNAFRLKAGRCLLPRALKLQLIQEGLCFGEYDYSIVEGWLVTTCELKTYQE